MAAAGRALPILGRYLVELMPSSKNLDDLQRLSARARAAADALTAQGHAVRLLRSVFMPEDGSWLLLFDASSAVAVESLCRMAALLPAANSGGVLTLRQPDGTSGLTGSELQGGTTA